MTVQVPTVSVGGMVTADVVGLLVELVRLRRPSHDVWAVYGPSLVRDAAVMSPT
ncbi:hypothetical protein [Streptomyces sp900116325]|uniref:hypothetical protein n=1 Tax=Streptomyces sp. 900116325 TaxID=3154295 RepID=UPI00331750C5